MSTEGDSRLQWIYDSDGTDQLRERYDVWAADYDSDWAISAGARPGRRCGLCTICQPRRRSARCRLWHRAGRHVIGAMGFAESSASICRRDVRRSAERGVYTELLEGSLLERLPFDDGRFGSVVSVGVFTYGHVDGSAFGELARVTAAGGHITITFRDDTVDQLGYRAEQQRLIDVGIWKLVEQTDPMALLHEDGEDILLRAWTWEVR